jgi:hypothetical protein
MMALPHMDARACFSQVSYAFDGTRSGRRGTFFPPTIMMDFEFFFDRIEPGMARRISGMASLE